MLGPTLQRRQAILAGSIHLLECHAGADSGDLRTAMGDRDRSAHLERHSTLGATPLHYPRNGGQGTRLGNGCVQPHPRGHLSCRPTGGPAASHLQFQPRPSRGTSLGSVACRCPIPAGIPVHYGSNPVLRRTSKTTQTQSQAPGLSAGCMAETTILPLPQGVNPWTAISKKLAALGRSACATSRAGVYRISSSFLRNSAVR